MHDIHIMSGLPGSGKSTWAKRHKQPEDFYISRDEERAALRIMTGNDTYFPVVAKEEYRIWAASVAQLIRESRQSNYADIWIDQTSLNASAICKLLNAVSAQLGGDTLADYHIHIEVIHTPVADCIARDEQRTGYAHVGSRIITDMARGFHVAAQDIADMMGPEWAPRIRVHHFDL